MITFILAGVIQKIAQYHCKQTQKYGHCALFILPWVNIKMVPLRLILNCENNIAICVQQIGTL